MHAAVDHVTYHVSKDAGTVANKVKGAVEHVSHHVKRDVGGAVDHVVHHTVHDVGKVASVAKGVVEHVSHHVVKDVTGAVDHMVTHTVRDVGAVASVVTGTPGRGRQTSHERGSNGDHVGLLASAQSEYGPSEYARSDDCRASPVPEDWPEIPPDERKSPTSYRAPAEGSNAASSPSSSSDVAHVRTTQQRSVETLLATITGEEEPDLGRSGSHSNVALLP